eukprot:jgi/Mesen1/1467/ME000132S00407
MRGPPFAQKQLLQALHVYRHLLPRNTRSFSSGSVGSTVTRNVEAGAGRPRPRREKELKPTTLQIGTGLVVFALFAKLLMIYDESQEPERVARKAKKFAEDQETLKPMSREKWEALQQVRPRTPFETQIARDTARLRTDGHLSWEDYRIWAYDVVIEAMARAEDAVRR